MRCRPPACSMLYLSERLPLSNSPSCRSHHHTRQEAVRRWCDYEAWAEAAAALAAMVTVYYLYSITSTFAEAELPLAVLAASQLRTCCSLKLLKALEHRSRCYTVQAALSLKRRERLLAATSSPNRQRYVATEWLGALHSRSGYRVQDRILKLVNYF